MTAIVGIINRQGVVFAADSAATVEFSSKHKISNHANKIFELAKFQPIGIALCGNMDFSMLPWEQIIKMYRMHLADGKFSTLHEYTDDFFSFVRKLLPDLADNMEVQLGKFVTAFYNEAISITRDKLNTQDAIVSDEKLLQMFFEVIHNLGNSYKNDEICSDCLNLTLEEFKHLADNLVTTQLTALISIQNWGHLKKCVDSLWQ